MSPTRPGRRGPSASSRSGPHAASASALLPNRPPGPELVLQKVAEPKHGKNRMHLDIEVADIETEATRLEALGAVRVQTDHLSEHGSTWILMTDPEGNEFCVCDGGTG